MDKKLSEFDVSDGLNEILGSIDRDGGVIVRNFISDDLRDRIFNEFKSYAEGFEPGLYGEAPEREEKFGFNTKRFTGLAAKSPSFAEVIDHELLHQWCGARLGLDYWINTGQAMIVGPGSEDQVLHRDFSNWSMATALGNTGHDVTLSIMLAMTDFTAEVGATRVVPGSQAWDDYNREAKPEDVTQAVMPAGSAMLYTGRVLHGAGANITKDKWRFGIHLSFVIGELTPEEANCLTVPWEFAQHYSERVKHMLGFYSLRNYGPKYPGLWQADMRELRDKLDPAPKKYFLTGVSPYFGAEGSE